MIKKMRQESILAVAVGLFVFATSAHAAEPAVQPTPTYPEVKQIISDRCQPCHSVEIETHGIYDAPGAIRYDTAEEIRAFAKGIERTAVETKTMPPVSTTGMTDDERKVIAAWFAAGAKVP